jgi:adenylyl cyclase-associated protein
MRTKKPPKKELEGNKWLIENYDNPGQMIEIEAAINHSLLISRCTKTTIRVIGKANAISLDNCTQTSLVIDSLVSAVDVIKCPKFEMQVLGMLPTIMLDQVDGAALYLNKETLHTTEVYTSKCTGVNINMPGRSDDDDYEEKPLPEQLKSVVRNGVLTTEIVEHAG